jgi:hypothetical protein
MALAVPGTAGRGDTDRGFYDMPSGNIWCPGDEPHQ